MRLHDILPQGETRVIGTHEFTAERIISFARDFDPQRFHVDPEAARQALFGGLCASGWHVCAAAMRCNVDYVSRESARIVAEGGIAPRIGPSPGIRDLKWLKPVFAGDVLTFGMQLVSTRPMPAHPDRLLCDIAFSGTNQKGETALQFTASVIDLAPETA